MTPRKYPAYAECPTCGRYGAVNIRGEMFRHRHPDSRTGDPCPGGACWLAARKRREDLTEGELA